MRMLLFAGVLVLCLQQGLYGFVFKTSDRLNTAERNVGSSRTRRVIKGNASLWPRNTITFGINANDLSPLNVYAIMDAIEEWTKFTCINFQYHKNIKDSVLLFSGSDRCWSYLGWMNEKVQPIYLAPSCRSIQGVLRHIGYALGLVNEIRRPDRNEYLTVNYENVEDGKRFQFKPYKTTQVKTFGIPYDYASVMQFTPTAFSKNGRPTIVMENSYLQTIIGKATKLSFGDIKGTCILYDCAARCGCLNARTHNCPSDGFLGKDCKCWCKSRTEGAIYCDGSKIKYLGNNANCYKFRKLYHL